MCLASPRGETRRCGRLSARHAEAQWTGIPTVGRWRRAGARLKALATTGKLQEAVAATGSSHAFVLRGLAQQHDSSPPRLALAWVPVRASCSLVRRTEFPARRSSSTTRSAASRSECASRGS
eukprot:scaffold28913_cov30-Tisochrysis_lutea.AAC.2